MSEKYPPNQTPNLFPRKVFRIPIPIVRLAKDLSLRSLGYVRC
jgi:hypothetical protein